MGKTKGQTAFAVNGNALRRARESAGLSRDDAVIALAARGVRCTIWTLKRWEDRGRCPAAALAAMADRYDVDMNKLFTRK